MSKVEPVASAITYDDFRKVDIRVGTIVAAERLWKTHKPAAIALMLASNSIAAIVAARNASTLRQLR